jgi:tryptophan synthase alpha chain
VIPLRKRTRSFTTSGSRGRLESLFRAMKKKDRCGLIAYVTCGDPSIDATVEIVRALESAGADAIELGVPFSDPIADGPVIQGASQRALERGTTIQDCLTIAGRIRETSDVPIILFTYLNPLMRFGYTRAAGEAAEAGIDAMLVTDLPPEESEDLRSELRRRGLGMVFLATPTSSPDRIRMVSRLSDGFVYYVSTTGVTGVRSELDPQLIERLDQVRARIGKPVAVGFGVSRHEHFLSLREHCSAVVVGSAIVRAIADGEPGGAAERGAAVVRSILEGDRE